MGIIIVKGEANTMLEKTALGLIQIKELCPYCNESNEFIIDPSLENQEYTEDCQICCQPIKFTVSFDVNQQFSLSVQQEND